LKERTDCPVYEWIANQSIFEYMIDFRNCLVHYRSFAISDNALVIKEGADISDIIEKNDYVFAPLARATYRTVDEGGFSVNIYLPPDKIFEQSTNGKKLARFTYEEKWNLLSQCRNFAQATSTTVLLSLRLVLKTKEPAFKYGN